MDCSVIDTKFFSPLDWQVLLLVSCITFNLFMNVVKLTPTARFEWYEDILF